MSVSNPRVVNDAEWAEKRQLLSAEDREASDADMAEHGRAYIQMDDDGQAHRVDPEYLVPLSDLFRFGR